MPKSANFLENVLLEESVMNKRVTREYGYALRLQHYFVKMEFHELKAYAPEYS